VTTPRVKRPLQWFDRQQDQADLAAGATTNLTLYSATIQGARFVRNATVTRMIVDLRLSADSVAQRIRLHWGIVIMNADARAAAAFLDPEDETDRAGWLVRGRMDVIQASLSDSSQWDRRMMDLRAQRMLRTEEDELQLIWHNSSSFVCKFDAYLRILVKMP